MGCGLSGYNTGTCAWIVLQGKPAFRGEKVRIVEIVGSRELRARMASMGLSPGIILGIINNNPGGPFIVAAHDTRLVLALPMAQAILVTHACRHPGKA